MWAVADREPGATPVFPSLTLADWYSWVESGKYSCHECPIRVARIKPHPRLADEPRFYPLGGYDQGNQEVKIWGCYGFCPYDYRPFPSWYDVALR